jgi:hypothetical protein
MYGIQQLICVAREPCESMADPGEILNLSVFLPTKKKKRN